MDKQQQNAQNRKNTTHENCGHTQNAQNTTTQTQTQTQKQNNNSQNAQNRKNQNQSN